MIWRMVEGRDVTPKYVVCGCPKHGLHLATGLISGYVPPMPPSIYNSGPWLGTFGFNSFSVQWNEMPRWFFLASRLQQGYFYQGHVGWRADIAEFLKLSRAAFVFVYRDLRDAAVSMAHHVTGNGNSANLHPAPALYRATGGFDEVLAACITGIGPFPGVVELWRAYAEWLGEDWIHAIRYEDALADLAGTARGIIEYGLHKIIDGIWDIPLKVEASMVDSTVRDMVAAASNTAASPTFRKGRPGEWREVFTERHKELFEQAGGNDWLQQMGYEVG